MIKKLIVLSAAIVGLLSFAANAAEFSIDGQRNGVTQVNTINYQQLVYVWSKSNKPKTAGRPGKKLPDFRKPPRSSSSTGWVDEYR